MAFPEEIETERLRLRPFAPGDRDSLVESLNNWEVTRWLSTNVPFPYRPADGEKYIAIAIADFKAGRSICYAVTDRDTGRHIGGIQVFSVTEEAEIGYWMSPDSWGRGYGSELLKAVMDAGFQTGIISRFVAQTAADNKGSRRILEKAGFIHQGTPPPDYTRCGHQEGCSEFYSLAIDDWRNP
ncbi:hypothetical protein MNBD_ALPHA01-1768 [hydrothermal vent metagenome]|uniref:N-acetyltransferase domain-containing protein n=1 Tax=hydrothermal vent metagenome TaxID=652676 RepID=A0A3B0SGH3_9ZZZZ